MRTRLAAASVRCLALAVEHGCTPATPAHGLFAWIDTHTDTDRLAQALLDDGWLTAPGSLFHASHRPSGLMRVNVATSLEPAFWQALASRRAVLSQRLHARVEARCGDPAIPGSA